MSGTRLEGRPARLAEIRVLTCNVQRAIVSRARRQATWLAGSDADLLVLTEVSEEESGDVLAPVARGRELRSAAPGAVGE